MTKPPIYQYARYTLQGPWLEAEPTILKDSHWAYIYARNIRKAPWPEAEPTIMTNPEWAYEYAPKILQAPWPEAEPIIAQNISHPSPHPDINPLLLGRVSSFHCSKSPTTRIMKDQNWPTTTPKA